MENGWEKNPFGPTSGPEAEKKKDRGNGGQVHPFPAWDLMPPRLPVRGGKQG